MLLVNHLGYERHGAKQAVLQAPPGLRGQQAGLYREEDQVVVSQVAIVSQGAVPGWKTVISTLWIFPTFRDVAAFTCNAAIIAPILLPSVKDWRCTPRCPMFCTILNPSAVADATIYTIVRRTF
ncbi:hypothetical protein PCI56_14630 [Plesiomonas shigelloides subsp. oncorhynchi]|nr:hypothetical protein [Plesiomonas shigelloides]